MQESLKYIRSLDDKVISIGLADGKEFSKKKCSVKGNKIRLYHESFSGNEFFISIPFYSIKDRLKILFIYEIE